MTKPTISAFSELAPLLIQKYERYLPTAFDESMSILQKVNKVIQRLDELGLLVGDIITQWNTVMEWVMNEGLSDTILEKLDEMVQDGTFEALINQSVLGEIQGQVTNKGADLKHFGAIGDGIADDTNAFLSAYAVSKIIYVPEGIYMIDNLTLENVTIKGVGTLKWKQSSVTKMVELKGKCLVDGVSFDGNGVNQGASLLPAIKLTEASETKISGCRFTNFHYKIIVSDVLSPQVEIVNNRFKNTGLQVSCDVVAVASSDWLLSGNYFFNIGDGHCIKLGGLTNSPSNLVERTIVSNNHFKDTDHNGVTCELYTQNTLVEGNTFENLPQAVKIEIEGDTVFNTTVDGNIFRNIYLATALNLIGARTTFTNNKCYKVLGGVMLGEYFVCSNNEFYDCGDIANTQACVNVITSATEGIVSNNMIVSPKYYGINIVSGSIVGNRIFSGNNHAIRVSGDGSIIANNHIDGATRGIVLQSTAKNTIVESNVIFNCSDIPISYSQNTDFESCLIKENIGTGLLELSLVVLNNTISVPMSAKTLRIDTEGSVATDTLTQINGGYVGQIIHLTGVSGSRITTVWQGGNVNLANDAQFPIEGEDTLTLVCTGTRWVEIARANNVGA